MKDKIHHSIKPFHNIEGFIDLNPKTLITEITAQEYGTNSFANFQKSLIGWMLGIICTQPFASTPHKITPLSPAKNTPPLWPPTMADYVP